MQVNNKMICAFFMVLFLSACKTQKEIPVIPTQPTQPVIDKKWEFETTPVWEDNFSADGFPDPAKWTLETGGSGWGNNELQFYTSTGNATISGGNLTIEARKESVSGKNYTSTRMITKGKGDWLYGRFEIRAKLPKGRGTWPAIWMLYSENTYGDWPASGEIDIMEHVGFDADKIHTTVHTSAYNHTRGTQRGSSGVIPGATSDFHVYRIDWTPLYIRWFIDGTQTFTFENENTGFTTWPFDKKFFMILNVAVGGNWGGAQGVDDTIFPAKMEVNYVKVFKLIP